LRKIIITSLIFLIIPITTLVVIDHLINKQISYIKNNLNYGVFEVNRVGLFKKNLSIITSGYSSSARLNIGIEYLFTKKEPVNFSYSIKGSAFIKNNFFSISENTLKVDLAENKINFADDFSIKFYPITNTKNKLFEIKAEDLSIKLEGKNISKFEQKNDLLSFNAKKVIYEFSGKEITMSDLGVSINSNLDDESFNLLTSLKIDKLLLKGFDNKFNSNILINEMAFDIRATLENNQFIINSSLNADSINGDYFFFGPFGFKLNTDLIDINAKSLLNDFNQDSKEKNNSSKIVSLAYFLYNQLLYKTKTKAKVTFESYLEKDNKTYVDLNLETKNIIEFGVSKDYQTKLKGQIDKLYIDSLSSEIKNNILDALMLLKLNVNSHNKSKVAVDNFDDILNVNESKNYEFNFETIN
jgi:hypothetical protein